MSTTTSNPPTIFREKISSGENHTCALENPNQQGGSKVLCWGSRVSGILGNGENASTGIFFNFSNPVLEVGSGSGLLNDITQVSAGKSSYLCFAKQRKSRLLGIWGLWAIGE